MFLGHNYNKISIRSKFLRRIRYFEVILSVLGNRMILFLGYREYNHGMLENKLMISLITVFVCVCVCVSYNFSHARVCSSQ